MIIFDIALQGYDASYENASAIARDGALLMEAGTYDAEPPLHSRPEGSVINGVQVWYCYGGHYYWFEEKEVD